MSGHRDLPSLTYRQVRSLRAVACTATQAAFAKTARSVDATSAAATGTIDAGALRCPADRRRHHRGDVRVVPPSPAPRADRRRQLDLGEPFDGHWTEAPERQQLREAVTGRRRPARRSIERMVARVAPELAIHRRIAATRRHVPPADARTRASGVGRSPDDSPDRGAPSRDPRAQRRAARVVHGVHVHNTADRHRDHRTAAADTPRRQLPVARRSTPSTGRVGPGVTERRPQAATAGGVVR